MLVPTNLALSTTMEAAMKAHMMRFLASRSWAVDAQGAENECLMLHRSHGHQLKTARPWMLMPFQRTYTPGLYQYSVFVFVNPKVTFPDVHEKKPTTATTLFTFGSRKQSGSAHMGYEPNKTTSEDLSCWPPWTCAEDVPCRKDESKRRTKGWML